MCGEAVGGRGTQNRKERWRKGIIGNEREREKKIETVGVERSKKGQQRGEKSGGKERGKRREHGAEGLRTC